MSGIERRPWKIPRWKGIPKIYNLSGLLGIIRV